MKVLNMQNPEMKEHEIQELIRDAVLSCEQFFRVTMPKINIKDSDLGNEEIAAWNHAASMVEKTAFQINMKSAQFLVGWLGDEGGAYGECHSKELDWLIKNKFAEVDEPKSDYSIVRLTDLGKTMMNQNYRPDNFETYALKP